MNSQDILSKKFDKAAMFGYKSDDVDAYMKETALEFEKISAQNKDLIQKLEILAKKVREYRNNEEQLKTAITTAQKQGNEILEKSKQNADDMINTAKEEAQRIIDEAQLKSAAMLNEANNEFARIKEETAKEQKGSKMALDDLKKEVSEFKKQLVATYKEHLEAVTALPEFKQEDYNPDFAKPETNENQMTLSPEKS